MGLEFETTVVYECRGEASARVHLVAAPTTESPTEPEAADTPVLDEAPARAEVSLEEDDQPRALWERAIGWAVVALCTWLVFTIIDPAQGEWDKGDHDGEGAARHASVPM